MNYQQALSQFILHKNTTSLHTLFEDDADLSIAAIYRNGFFRSCREVISSTFPTAQSVAGEERFKELTHAFIQAYPPDTGTLTGYGKQFPEWLELQDIEENPLLYELAHLDWAWIACLYGQDATPLTAESFQALLINDDGSGLPNISLIKNAQLITSNEKAISFWLNAKKGAEIRDNDLGVASNTQCAVMWRPALDVMVRVLPADESHFLEEILTCNNLNNASENTLKKNPTFNLPEHFSDLLQYGLLSINREP